MISKRTMPCSAARSEIGSRRDVDILRSLAWAGYLTTSQIVRLHFPSSRTAQRRMRTLLNAQLVGAHLQGGALHRENVYTLSPKGATHLETLGLTNLRRCRVPRLQKLSHSLAIRDLFVAFRVAERAALFQVEDLRFDSDLGKEPILAAAGLIPDLLAVVCLNGQRRIVGCEVDLGTESIRTVTAKLDVWSRLLNERVLGDASLIIAIAPIGRVQSILRIVAETGCGGTVLGLDQIVADPTDSLQQVFARAIRTVRTAMHHESLVSKPIGAPKDQPFRILGS